MPQGANIIIINTNGTKPNQQFHINFAKIKPNPQIKTNSNLGFKQSKTEIMNLKDEKC